MHGLALILTTACLGVDFGWEQQGGELDYLIQLEPALLEQLKGGELVLSDIPEEVRGGRRFVLRVGTGEVPRRGRQVVPVAGGFGAGAEGVPVARPAVIRAPGFVANNPVEPAMNPFNAWNQPLQPAPFQPQPLQPAPNNFDPRFAPAANDPRLIPLPGPPAQPQPDPRVIAVADNSLPPIPGFGPPEMPAGRLPVRPPQVDPLAAAPANPPNNPPFNNPPVNPPLVNNPPINNGPVGGNWNVPPVNPPFNNNPQPPFNNNPPFNNANQPQNPVRDPWNVANDPWANRNPPQNNGNQPQNPAGGWIDANPAPWRDNLASRDPLGQPRWDNGRPSTTPNGYPYTPISYQDTRPQSGLAKAAQVVKEARITNTFAAATAARASPVLAVKVDPDANKPWWPLMLTAMGFFLSIGGNMYLWWTWWDSHRRYLGLIGELRTARSN